MIVTCRVANVATVIISIESITDVKTCNGVRTAAEEEVQNSSSKVADPGTQIKFNLARGSLFCQTCMFHQEVNVRHRWGAKD